MNNKELRISLIQMIDKKLKEDPFTMKKKMQESYTKHGFLSVTQVPAVYDTKVSGTYVIEELKRMINHWK